MILNDHSVLPRLLPCSETVERGGEGHSRGSQKAASAPGNPVALGNLCIPAVLPFPHLQCRRDEKKNASIMGFAAMIEWNAIHKDFALCKAHCSMLAITINLKQEQKIMDPPRFVTCLLNHLKALF